MIEKDERRGRSARLKVELTIDEDKLARVMGAKAYINKSGKSVALNGAIKVKIIEAVPSSKGEFDREIFLAEVPKP